MRYVYDTKHKIDVINLFYRVMGQFEACEYTEYRGSFPSISASEIEKNLSSDLTSFSENNNVRLALKPIHKYEKHRHTYTIPVLWEEEHEIQITCYAKIVIDEYGAGFVYLSGIEADKISLIYSFRYFRTEPHATCLTEEGEKTYGF